MDSLNSQKAPNSHPPKVVNDQSNKNIVTKTSQSDLKDTNFEYEDNEWDDVGIGSLIIDLDADIEKSSSTSLENNSSLVIPISPAENITPPRSSSKNKEKFSDSESSEKSKRKETSNMSAAANSGNKSSKISIDHQATLDKGLKMKIKRTKTGTKTSDSKHEIVKPDHNGIVSSDDSINNSKKSQNAINIPSSPSSSNKRGNNSHKKEKSNKEKCGSKEKLELPTLNQTENVCCCNTDKIGNQPSSTPCNSTNCVKLRDMSNRIGSSTTLAATSTTDKQNLSTSASANTPGPPKDSKTSSHPSASKHKDQIKFADFSKSLSNVNNSVVMNSSSEDVKSTATSSPPLKKPKCDSKSMVDVCIGTSIGTITEPDCLGPCEPGTSVTLEGIVWHETEGGVLAVNVTWRGKTYVGTLIDCTKHDWAPPRFCDSPTEELDSRLPKGGRAKRGRNSVTNNDLLNFTETRSSVHSKLRNGGSKGRASRNSSSTNINISNSSAITNTPSTSPTTFSVPRPEKRRKSKDESPPFNGNQSAANNAGNAAVAQASASKKPKSVASPCAISPVLLECPEQDCGKKYKHANGLKYHQSHAHGINADDDSLTAPESPQRSQSPEIKADDKAEEETNLPKINFESVKPSLDNITDTAVDRFPIIQKNNNSTTENAPTSFDSRPAIPPNKTDPTSNTTTKFTNISDVEQTSNDSNDVQNSNFYIQSKASNLTKKKIGDSKERSEDNCDAIGISNITKPEGPARSPAYSDISDDSNTATDNGLNDKLLNANNDAKKVAESQPANLAMGPYNSMYGPFYQPSSFFSPPESQSTKAINPPPPPQQQPQNPNQTQSQQQQQQQPQTLQQQQPNSLMKEPSPLDLMNKIQPSKSEPTIPSPSNSSVVGKISHYQHYPYNFIQPNYPYMENSYGNLSSDEKAPQGIQVKEELRKESSSPDNMKNKPIKTEPKEVKIEPGQQQQQQPQQQPTNLQSPQHMNPYHQGLYQRHNMPPSISREEDLQKYFIYPEQRRPSVGGTPTNLSKDERKSQSPTTPQSSSFREKSSSKNLTTSTPSSSSKPPPTTKDIKSEEKDVKVKQEGQKPTMETQGPPPPPTSQQYYLPYGMGPGASPFFPDPGHQMYRNMLVPPSPYNPSYHLQMARFTSPEDLSRNPNTKALDLLQQHANQYYNNHKIHELSERHSQLKSPTSNPKIPISSSPTMTGQSSTVQNNANITPSNLPPGSTSSPQSLNLKTGEKPERPDNLKDPNSSIPGSNGRPPSPPPQRHVHTHLHTHQLAGIGYHPYPYVNPAVLASQQAVINPFANPPANK